MEPPSRRFLDQRRQPKAHVSPRAGVFRERLKGGDFAWFELIEETRVGGPEEADVGDLVEDHGDAFESESEGPADFVFDLCRNRKGKR